MFRITIEITEEQNRGITKLANSQNIPFSEKLREILDLYLEQCKDQIDSLQCRDDKKLVSGSKKEHCMIDGVDHKHCSKCDKWFTLDCFHKQKVNWDGLYTFCKKCKNEYSKNLPKHWSKKNKDRLNLLRKEKYKNDREYREERRVKSKQHREENRDKINKQKREASKTHEYRAKRSIYDKNRRINDLDFRLTSNLRSRLSMALRGSIKSGHTFELIGCSLEELKNHVQKQFKPGMSWENYGEWQIDHIIPCAVFDMTKKEEQEKCFHYLNLQPLWKQENLAKKDKIV